MLELGKNSGGLTQEFIKILLTVQILIKYLSMETKLMET